MLLFLGTVRDHHAGRAVAGLTYSAYRPMAEETLEQLAADHDSTSNVVVIDCFDLKLDEAVVQVDAVAPDDGR